MINAASGGALMDKTPVVARHLISNMASNTQQFEIRGATTNKFCGNYTSVEHFIDMCPTLQETESDNVELVGAIGGNLYGRQPYQTWQFDGQQFGRPQQYKSSLGQGQYAIPRFGPTSNISAPNHNYHQQPGSRYPAQLFQQH
ncbi:hypothetical protein CR513_00318, partial [Mucuna pruriens]